MNAACPAEWVATLLAAAPSRFGGVHLRSPARHARASWLAALRAAAPADAPWIRVPASADADTLLGGLDLAATLAVGRPMPRRGLMARADGGFLVLSMAERASQLLLACLQQAMDTGTVTLEREGLRSQVSARFCLIVLDEGQEQDPVLPAGLLDRLAFSLDEAALETWLSADEGRPDEDRRALGQQARRLIGDAAVSREAAGALATETEEGALVALCESAWKLGIASLRAPILAIEVAQVCAMLAGRTGLESEDLVMAGSLVFSSRANAIPVPQEEPAPPPSDAQPSEPEAAAPPPPPTGESQEPSPDEQQQASPPPSMPRGDTEQVVDSVLAALPPDVLAKLAEGLGGMGSGRVASLRPSRMRQVPRHGRPVGSRPGDPRRGQPLDLLATLRAALPWQRLRRPPEQGGARLAIRSSDLHIRRLKPRTRTTAVFAVDASGSAALNRLNEAKGAVQSLLAQCYVRRDQVALITFRGAGAELALPPTRSLARVRRELCALPGGGGTPLASGIALAAQITADLRRRGDAPLLVLLTDGRANVSRDGVGGRARAETEAFAAADEVRASGLPVLLVDIAPQPQERARLLARALGGEYLALPVANAERLAAAVQARMPAREGQRA